ncbi:hypothetical protein BRETT_001002 [Brettanomyces bruxellensis]|uniref:Glu-AdT subunit F n=1 Tax=Dekkera bruxellensis TaxID=5007 RepID=A0A871RFL9_DEKBR|nr:uncharacterized protein BRETT_001002 [Brettanomyces bruxellensis]QOU21281.1 hypothetical protein BRETT_001002 [Brettanomyces bruxellensis]
MFITRRLSYVIKGSRQLFTQAVSKAAVGKKIENEDQLNELFQIVSWKTSELTAYDKTAKVGRKMVEGLLKLSGLKSTISNSAKLSLQHSLADQLQFVNKLHSIDIPEEEEQLGTFRLIDDVSKENVLNFAQLQKEVNDVRPSLLKGEIENTWNPLSLAKEHDEEYFVVKEGLIKKNKVSKV